MRIIFYILPLLISKIFCFNLKTKSSISKIVKNMEYYISWDEGEVPWDFLEENEIIHYNKYENIYNEKKGCNFNKEMILLFFDEIKNNEDIKTLYSYLYNNIITPDVILNDFENLTSSNNDIQLLMSLSILMEIKNNMEKKVELFENPENIKKNRLLMAVLLTSSLILTKNVKLAY